MILSADLSIDMGIRPPTLVFAAGAGVTLLALARGVLPHLARLRVLPSFPR
jgi:hypothetical protein